MSQPASPASPRQPLLQAAIRQARSEAAERTGVSVNLRDADLARLELLNEALDPVFADLPAGADVFDRGIMPGVTPRLWIDMVAHVGLDRDQRTYRLMQDTRQGRRTLAESPQVPVMVAAVTDYVARRLVEREQALSDRPADSAQPVATSAGESRWNLAGVFVLGLVAGGAALLAAAWLLDPLAY
jgi:hypothetical protein